MPARPDALPITVLHVSDVHFGMPEPDGDGRVVRDTLIEAAHGAGRTPDLLVFTGDLAYSGRDEELCEGLAWLRRLVEPWDCPVALVPGNHDVDRTKADRLSLRAARREEDYAEWLGRLQEDAARLQAFLDRSRSHPDLTLALEWDDAGLAARGALEVRGLPVRLYGANTAFLSCGDDDTAEGEDRDPKLVLDLTSLNGFLGECDPRRELVLALGHHPLSDCLATWNQERVRLALQRGHRGAHAWLHGHTHDPQATYVNSSTGTSLVTLAAGAAYQTSRYPQRFAFCRFGSETDRARVDLYAYSADAGTWFHDESRSQPFLARLPEAWSDPRPFGPAPSAAASRRTDPALQREIDSYRLTVAARHEHLHLVGFSKRFNVPLRLPDLYVPLSATADLRPLAEGRIGSGEEAKEHLSESERCFEVSLEKAFSAAAARGGRRGLVILGDPGSGKTTHLRLLALSTAKGDLTVLGLDEDVLPLFLPLRSPPAPGADLAAFVEASLREQEIAVPADFARGVVARGRLLLLLDGLDEVADPEERERVARWVDRAVESHRDSRFVVTCRYAGYPADRFSSRFLELHLKPLEPEEAAAFVREWYEQVEVGTAAPPEQDQARAVARDKAGELNALLQSPDFAARRVAELTRNPLLLTALCLVHYDRGNLPQRRGRLYEQCLDVLLERWRRANDVRVRLDAQTARAVLEPLAYWMHGEEGRRQASEDQLAPVVAEHMRASEAGHARADPDPEPDGGDPKAPRHPEARAFLRTVRDESGLLVGWGDDRYGFLHHGFQEYLVARRIRSRVIREPEILERLVHRFGDSWWREVVLLFLAIDDQGLFDRFMTAVLESDVVLRDPDLLAACYDDALSPSLQPFLELLARSPGPDAALQRRQLAALRVVEHYGRQHLAGLRAKLAHHPMDEIARRFRAATTADTWTTVRGGCEMVRIPSGDFRMGSPESEKGRDEDEGPVHEVSMPAFSLGRFPVTNEEYARYLDENPDGEQPRTWADRRFNGPRQPVVGVTWKAARAFAEWAGGRLPSEAEWEYACRAGTTTRYWAGDAEDDLERVAWYDRNSGGRTHPVGEKPANPFGLHDVHGNVWEWCEDAWSSSYDESRSSHPGPYRRPDPGAGRVVRGGSWWVGARFCRSAFRGRGHPGDRDPVLGFRVAGPASPSS